MKQKIIELSKYLEGLPDWRSPRFTLSYWRVDDFRRKAMEKNEHPVFKYEGYIYLYLEPAPQGFSSTVGADIRCSSVDCEEVIDKLYTAIKRYMSGDLNLSAEKINWIE